MLNMNTSDAPASANTPLHPRGADCLTAPLPTYPVAIAKPNVTYVDPKHLKGKSAEEKRHLIELNERCAVVFQGSHLRIIWQPTPDKAPLFISVQHAREREAIRVVEKKTEDGTIRKVSMFKEWMQWEGRRQYNEVRFAPGVNDPTIFNLFNGWSVEPKQGDWSILRDHIEHVICQSKPELFAWFMTWLAQMFQFPNRKPPVAVVIRGQKGTGKSIVFDFIQGLMRDNFCKIADGRRALGSFNAHYEKCLLLLMEEAFWAGDQRNESMLKDLITSQSLVIERKGIDAYMASNYMRVAMISNERWVLPATHDERRFAVFDCSNKQRTNIGYFQKMVEQMDNGGSEAMLFDLLNYVPPAGWDVLMTPPVTEGLKEQMVDSLRGIDRFMYDLLVNGMYECDACDEGGIFLTYEGAREYSMKDLRLAVRDYLADNFTSQKNATFDLIERAVIDWFDARVFVRRGRTNSSRWVEFPNLEESRDHTWVRKGIDIRHDWDDGSGETEDFPPRTNLN